MNANEFMKTRLFNSLLAAMAALFYAANMYGAEDLGLFKNQGEVGRPSKVGSVVFDPAAQTYVVAGGGANMWGTNDDFHFVWKRLNGSFSVAADIEGLGSGNGNAHRKACLLVRQDLSPGSAYVDVAVHASGLTSLQWREQTGGPTREVQSSLSGPVQVGLERQGDVSS